MTLPVIQRFREKFGEGQVYVGVQNGAMYQTAPGEALFAFLLEVDQEAYQRGLKEPHLTEEGYCCACGYDIACMNEKIARGKEEVVDKAIEIVDNVEFSDTRLSQAVKELQEFKASLTTLTEEK